jgi:hypothetical protein
VDDDKDEDDDAADDDDAQAAIMASALWPSPMDPLTTHIPLFIVLFLASNASVTLLLT